MTTTRPMRSLAAWKLPLLAILCAAGMWTYADRVLIPHQVSDAAAHGWPRGNLSDLYKQWIGAQELLLHGRDPYSAEVTREIQAGYYGARSIRIDEQVKTTNRRSPTLFTSPSTLRPPSIFRLRSCARDASGSCSGSPLPLFRCGRVHCAGLCRCGDR